MSKQDVVIHNRDTFEMRKCNVEDIIIKIGNTDTAGILKWLEEIPMIKFSNSSIQLYIYSCSLMLVVSNPTESLALEGLLHPDRFNGQPIPVCGNYRKLNAAPKESLTFHKFFFLNHDCCLSVVTGQLNQLWHILGLFY